jgi:PAS domain S-box-containing protein
MVKKPGGSKKVTALRRQAEEAIRATRRDIVALPIQDVQQLVHELQVHQIELEMQNEELRRSQVKLEAARDRYVELYDGAPTGYLTVDSMGMILEANLSACTLLGVTRSDVVGKPLIRFIEGNDQATYLRHVRTLWQTQVRQVCDLSLARQGGSPCSVRFESMSVWNDAREDTLARISLTDVTEHKRLEAQFLQAQKMEAVGRLAGGVAHDFNNLLTIINGYSTLLIDQLSPEDPRHEMAVETLRAGERAGELTKQLLAFTRKQVLLPQPLNFNESLHLISSMLSRLLGEEVALTMDLAPDLWSINGDKGQLNQVTMNLAINARDAMPNGGNVTIVTRNLSVPPECPNRDRRMLHGDYVHVSVHDTGHGMSPETIAHVFEPFFTTKEVGRGTGLGLATVYGIVKQSQGYIFVDSTLHQGATFHLYYPRVLAAPAVAEIQQVRPKNGSERLLVVEDQDAVRTLIVRKLKQDGYQVLEAASGDAALRAAAAQLEPIQALVTDVIMSGMSGFVVAERLRVRYPGLRVLFMSGYTDREEPAFLDEPGTAFIQKPFVPDDLARRLRSLLDKSPAQGEQ